DGPPGVAEQGVVLDVLPVGAGRRDAVAEEDDRVFIAQGEIGPPRRGQEQAEKGQETHGYPPGAATAGSQRATVVPWPGAVLTSMPPPCPRTMPRTTDSPSPRPTKWVV